MPLKLYDYECYNCKTIFEALGETDEREKLCPRCPGDVVARRIISVSGQYLGNQDATWIRSVLEVVDKDSKARHVQDFIKNPSRKNYQDWMKGEGIKPIDHTVRGGPPVFERPHPHDRKPLVDELFRRHRERKSLSVNLLP
jgi:putative FmdB family regulatory protein